MLKDKRSPVVAAPRRLTTSTLESQPHDTSSKASLRRINESLERNNMMMSPRIRTGQVAGIQLGRHRVGCPNVTDMVSTSRGSPRCEGNCESSFDFATSEVSHFFNQELAMGSIEIPVLTDYRDLLSVIDARERCLQTLRTYLASLSVRVAPRSVDLLVARPHTL